MRGPKNASYFELDVDGTTQRVDYQNGTLQTIDGWDVTIHTYLKDRVRQDGGLSQEGLKNLLEELFYRWAETALDLGTAANFDVEIGEREEQ
jgi:hypothetical protein